MAHGGGGGEDKAAGRVGDGLGAERTGGCPLVNYKNKILSKIRTFAIRNLVTLL